MSSFVRMLLSQLPCRLLSQCLNLLCCLRPCRCSRLCQWPSAPGETSFRLVAEVKPQCRCCRLDSKPPMCFLPKSKAKCCKRLSGLAPACPVLTLPKAPLDFTGGRWFMEGRQRCIGVTVMDSKLAFGRASEWCIHEVTSPKPLVVGGDGTVKAVFSWPFLCGFS